MRLLLGSFVCSALVTGAGAQWFPSSPGPNVTVVYPPAQPPPVVVQVPPDVVIMRASPIEYIPVTQVTYLIAFKNSVVRLADQYWVKGKILYYVTTDHQQMTAPLDTVDRTVSQRLNSEQDVVFSLPPEQQRILAQAHVIRHTAISVHKRCRCTTGPPPAGGQASRANSKAN